MLILFLICAAMVLLALWFVLPPLLQATVPSRADELREANLLVYRDQFRELEADLQNGLTSQDQYEVDKSSLERRLLDDTARTKETAPISESAGPKKIGYAVAAAIPVLATALYFVVGNPKALTPQPGMQMPAAGPFAGQMSAEQIEANVAKLAQRLEQNPNDGPGWIMLGRSYANMRRFSDAANAYGRAVAITTDNSQLWADYAEALAMANNRQMAGKPLEAANRALALDEKNEKALALAGSAAFEAGDYQKAIDYWQRLMVLLPPTSEAANAVSGELEKAKKLAAGKGSR